MEAFFPLLVTAAIYFLLTWLLTFALKLVQNKLNANREQRKIKGVD